jgi:hypothetical protein
VEERAHASQLVVEVTVQLVVHTVPVDPPAGPIDETVD